MKGSRREHFAFTFGRQSSAQSSVALGGSSSRTRPPRSLCARLSTPAPVTKLPISVGADRTSGTRGLRVCKKASRHWKFRLRSLGGQTGSSAEHNNRVSPPPAPGFAVSSRGFARLGPQENSPHRVLRLGISNIHNSLILAAKALRELIFQTPS